MANYTVFGGRKQHIIRKHNERKNLDAELADRCIFIVIFVCVVGKRQKRGGIGKLNIMRILLPTVSKERYVKNAHPTKVRAIKMDRHLNLLAWWTLPCRVSNKKAKSNTY